MEVQFSLDEKSGETLSRVGTTVDGVTEAKIPDELLTHSATSNYRIYAYIYLTDETSGNTKYEITIPVRVRSKPTSPAEDPETDPDLFRETVVAVNASAERAENAASSATESAASAEETLIEIKRVTDGISENIENANTMKSELSDMINSAGIEKKELESSIGKAGEAKTQLDNSISSDGEQKSTLDTTIEQANTIDASLKDQIGSAEQIQENIEQIRKNKDDISLLNEDLEEVKDKKITKFYASNQGETHLADSDNGKIQDMIIYGRSSQFTTTGKNLLKYPYIETTKTSQGIMFTDNKDGSINVSGSATGMAYYNLYSNRDGKRLTLASGTYKLVTKGRRGCDVVVNNGVTSAKNEGTFTITEGHNEIYCYIAIQEGLTVDETIYPMIQLASSIDESYEPYTGGKPSPNPDYPQEIKRVVNPTMKVCGKNLWDNFKTLSLGNVEQKNGTYIATADNMQVDITMKSVGARPLLLKANNAYTFSLKTTVSISSPKFVCLRYTNGESNNIIFTNKNFVNFVPKRDVEKVGFILYESVAGDKVYDVQLEMGSEATYYEPYTEQSVQLPYTLNAIPVASGGNVTINGQQYIADRVVEKDGVFGIERNIREIHTNTKTMNNSEEYPGWKNVEGISDVTYYNVDPVGDSRKLTLISNFTRATFLQNNKGTNNILYYIKHIIGYSQSELIAKAIDVDMYIRLQDAIFEPLPGDIQAKLRTLVTNYPVTNISVTSDQLDGYTVFNYPISMANGWNYVKQQLGDTRDYIYDMDIQSAEAYVNSEYAVALTELEV
ncbi:hypothetical protein [Dorea sp. AF36-15AT]|uniref:hypothetical protein n=1 Tax=Dorea sp. AF36-15AT TaxID=2292041 RepID=UPI00131470DD|nr:hypothetical protein [Dorea sp. AF36-15AT]